MGFFRHSSSEIIASKFDDQKICEAVAKNKDEKKIIISNVRVKTKQHLKF